MALMTLATIISHATRLAQDARIPMSQASEYANIAISIVGQADGIQHAPKETVGFASTTTSDNRLGFPTDYDYTLGLKLGVPTSWSTATSRDTSWVGLDKQPATWNDPYQSGSSGEPRFYNEFATWFELMPSPDSRYSVEIRYMRKTSELTNSTATPPFDEQWHWAVALKTAELISQNNSDFTNESANRSRYKTYLSELRPDQGKKRMDARGAYVTVAWRRR